MWNDFIDDMKEIGKRCFLGLKPLCHEEAFITNKICNICYERWIKERGLS